MRIRVNPHSHTWLPYLTPNGVTHLTMLLIDIKILQNHAEKKSWILNTLPNGVRLARENCNKLRVKAKVISDK